MNIAETVSTIIQNNQPHCFPELIILGMGGQKVKNGIFQFADKSMITGDGVEYVGGVEVQS